jgi:hypothetical protein
MNKIFRYFLALTLFSIQTLYAFPLSLNGDWYIKQGLHFNYSHSPETWEKRNDFPIAIDFSEDPNFPNHIEVSFYHELNLTEEMVQLQEESLSIFFPYITNVFKIYLNGQMIFESGRLENGKITLNGSKSNFTVKLPLSLLKTGKNEIYIQTTSHKLEEISLYGGSDFVLDKVSENEKRKSERLALMLLFVYGYVGVYHLLLFFKRPIEKYNLYFGGFAFLTSIYSFTRSNAIQEIFFDPLVVIRIEYPVLFFTSAFSILFFEEFLGKKTTIFSKIFIGLITIFSIGVLFFDRPVGWVILKIWQYVMLGVIFYFVYLMIKAFRSDDKDARRVVIGFIVMVSSIFLDLVGAARIIPGFINFGLGKFGFMAFVIGIAFVLANKFLRVHNEVEELNETLELKVLERTEQLQKTLSEVQNLKLQQDGDYFLTSLLIRPLMVNQVRSKSVTIDFFIKQKKTFEFKNKIYEIGGDICIANQIRLRGKDYTIFINGDAMGKSIQGAGGALVLGVVFRAVITRTQMNTQNDILPEMWLKNCFIELQNVFVSFDGSMLISVVMGLIEEKTGMMYFINAEHPWSVLYRDGKASFLEEEIVTRKIGILGLDGQLMVKTFHLQQGDMVIIGSDGRDDLLLGYDESGQRIINENEEKFLRNVELGKGDIKAITDSVLKSGELTDDYTLLKIGYKTGKDFEELIIPENYYTFASKASEAYEKGDQTSFLENAFEAIDSYPNDKELLGQIIDTLYEKRDYTKASKYIELYLDIFPEENKYLLIGSFCAKMIGHTKTGIELGEALRLREPNNVKNLLNLADIYHSIGNKIRSNKIAQEALENDPSNEKALEIQKKSLA